MLDPKRSKVDAYLWWIDHLPGIWKGPAIWASLLLAGLVFVIAPVLIYKAVF